MWRVEKGRKEESKVEMGWCDSSASSSELSRLLTRLIRVSRSSRVVAEDERSARCFGISLVQRKTCSSSSFSSFTRRAFSRFFSSIMGSGGCCFPGPSGRVSFSASSSGSSKVTSGPVCSTDERSFCRDDCPRVFFKRGGRLLGEEKRPGRAVYCSSAVFWEGVAGKSSSSSSISVFVASAFVLCVRGVVSCLGTGDGICASAVVSPLVLPLSSRAARESRVLSPSIKARACFPRASISARPFTSGGPGDFGRCRRSELPRARLGLVGDANEYLRGGLRGGSFRGLGGLSETRLVGDRENRRGGCFKGLVCLSSRGIWDREESDMRRGGCFKGLDRPSPPTGEDVFLLFLAGSSMAVGDATMRRCVLCRERAIDCRLRVAVEQCRNGYHRPLLFARVVRVFAARSGHVSARVACVVLRRSRGAGIKQVQRITARAGAK